MNHRRKVSTPSAPRKDSGAHAVRDPIHIAAAFTYGRMCSPKKVAYAWQILVATARKYRTGVVVGALTRIGWEIDRLESVGIDTAVLLRFLHRVRRRARRRREDRSRVARAA